MLPLIFCLTFISMFILVFIGLRTYVPVEGAAEMRLRALDSIMENRTDMDEEMAKPFSRFQ